MGMTWAVPANSVDIKQLIWIIDTFGPGGDRDQTRWYHRDDVIYFRRGTDYAWYRLRWGL
jgi:hypothetical protein